MNIKAIKLNLTPAQLALLGTVAGAMASAAIEAIRHGTGSVDWPNVAVAALLAGLGAFTQARPRPTSAPDPAPADPA